MKINPTMNRLEVLTAMSAGNPGALEALAKLSLPIMEEIDPITEEAHWYYILLLDFFGIYGTDIYVLYNDICMKEIPKMMAILKAVEIAIFPVDKLKEACSKQDRSGCSIIPVEELYSKVKEHYPKFDQQICYKTNKPCPYNCQGLCKESY